MVKLMPQASLKRDVLQRAVDQYALSGSAAKAARVLNLSASTLKHHLEEARRQGVTPTTVPRVDDSALLHINENLRAEVARLTALAGKPVRPHFTVRQDNAGRTSKIRVVCIGDAHDSPSIPDKSRFEWIGKYIRQEKPDVVVQIGDFATLDSLNTHIPNENYDGKAKPSFERDMASLNEAMGAMNLNGVDRHCTLGNHERRLFHFEQSNPEVWGIMQAKLQEVMERHRWTFSAYGQVTYYGGVGFVHAALNVLGKTYGGKNAEMTIANDSVADLVIGHSHVERAHRARKLDHKHITVLNVGCALPDGYIEEYAQHALTGWSYGIADLVIQHGHIQSRNWISMQTLEERYGT